MEGMEESNIEPITIAEPESYHIFVSFSPTVPDTLPVSFVPSNIADLAADAWYSLHLTLPLGPFLCYTVAKIQHR